MLSSLLLAALQALQGAQQAAPQGRTRELPAIRVAAAYSGRAGQTRVKIPRLEAEVRVDGILNEAAWRDAALLTGFNEYRPVEGRAAEDSTEVRVWYSAHAIYFGVRAFAPAGAVR